MAKLTDTQSLLLSIAAQQDNSLYPLPAALIENGEPAARAAKAIIQLQNRCFIEERETSIRTAICRTDGDVSFGMFITATGLAAIGIEEAAGKVVAPPLVNAPRQTKAELVLGMLRREEGATIAELIEATGWLPHTTRAALTGLRKKGYVVDKGKRDAATC
jgi:hypothetical protein